MTSVENTGLANCPKLSYIDLHNCGNISYTAFERSSVLNTVILRKIDSVCTLGSTNAFGQTPFASGKSGGICLVPRSLIESYQTATNWSTLYAGGRCLFWALEDYTVDDTIDGEINWDKLNTDREGAFA